ncbi:MAG: DNA polymerase I [Chloroflexota bacterium]|nr:DNA polymerase I [Chloroflexota bacterium]
MTKTLYLIDVYAQIFRAYYAIRNGMHSQVTGEPTHAVFGITAMLLKLFGQCRPDYVVAAVDTPGNTFRDDLYPEYKGTRRPTPDDLISQVPRVQELMERFGIPVVGQAGLEADDIIATITQRVLDDPSCADVEIRIVSKDKDLEQLLGERVTMFDVHTDTTMDVAGLLASKGITPAQVVDSLALIGDAVDNVPGVAGIGPKTAAQLVQQFGSLAGILERLDEVKGKRREALALARPHLPLSLALVTLKRDADFPFSLEAARVHPPDPNKLIPFFQQLGFHRFQDEVRRLAQDAAGQGTASAELTPPAGAPPAGATIALQAQCPGATGLSAGSSAAGTLERSLITQAVTMGDYATVTTPQALQDLVSTLVAQSLISVDTETTGLQRDSRLCGLSFSWQTGTGVYVPTRSPEQAEHLDAATVLAALRPVLENPNVAKCGHNLKFDAGVLFREGVSLRGVVFDSMLASMLLDPAQPSHKLDHLAAELLAYRMIPIVDLIGEGEDQTTMDAVPLAQIAPYAAEDADIALRLNHLLAPRMEAAGLIPLMRDVEAPLSTVLAEMEARGIICDGDELVRQGQGLSGRVDELRREVHTAAGSEFHLDSPKQLAEVLFDRLGLTPGKKTKTGRSTDVQVLERLASQENRSDPRTGVPRLVLEYRQLNKLMTTYLGNLQEAIDPGTGRIHSTFHQLVAATGRLASQNPNLQNIPVRRDVGRQIRKAFLAPTGHVLLCADYSQIELRLLAHLSLDPALVTAFELEQDIHTAVAANVFGVAAEAVTRTQRNQAKTINFGIIYGVTAFGLARRIEGLDVAAAAELIASYKVRFPGIETFLRDCVQHALEHGHVTTILGRRRAIPELQSANGTTRALGERLAINSVVQGSAADLIKVAMVNVQRRIDRDALPLRLLLQIHDELVLESPTELAAEHAALVREEMERAMTLRVPLRADVGVGADWMSAK